MGERIEELERVLGRATDDIVVIPIRGRAIRKALLRLPQDLPRRALRRLFVVGKPFVSLAAVLKLSSPLLDRLVGGVFSQRSRCPQ